MCIGDRNFRQHNYMYCLTADEGNYTVTVTKLDAQSNIGATSSIWSYLKYVNSPAISGVNPSSGASNGGTTVTISGSSLFSEIGTGDPTPSVSLGSVACTSVSNDGSGNIVCTTGATTTFGAVPITVTKTVSSQTFSATSGNIFTYNFTTPAITAITPAAINAAASGTTITLTGSGFSGADHVTVTFNSGTISCTSATATSDTTITCTAPQESQAAYTVAVSKLNALNSIGATSSDFSSLKYVNLPVISGVTPTSGPNTGSTAVSISGSNFSSEMGAGDQLSVKIGSSSCAISDEGSDYGDTYINCSTGIGSGTVPITVIKTVSSQTFTGTSGNIFTYTVNIGGFHGGGSGGGSGCSSTISNTNNDATSPALAVLGSNLYLVWSEHLSAGGDLIRAAVYNGDSSCPPTTAIDSGSLNYSSSKSAINPSVVAFDDGTGAKLYVAWQELYDSGDYAIRVRRYDPSTSTWTWEYGGGSTGLLYTSADSASNPQLVTVGSSLYAVWAESAESASPQIEVEQFQSGSWSNIDSGSINYNSNNTGVMPQGIAFNNKLYVAWYEGAGSSNNPYKIRAQSYDPSQQVWNWEDGGGSTGMNINPANNATNPSFSTYNSNLYAQWSENDPSGNGQIRMAKHVSSGDWDHTIDGNGTKV